jgi:hypothetical protein
MPEPIGKRLKLVSLKLILNDQGKLRNPFAESCECRLVPSPKSSHTGSPGEPKWPSCISTFVQMEGSVANQIRSIS